ncbi:DNA-binding protein [Streptomyces ziwulingensis]|uniref:Uncharacterized protein n=1 Tax=Streptomyces ziwulingensis TaxID=1045501 RepID=A0ABP9C8U3_9ACTN
MLNRDLDDLFPRAGLPDLIDLRCDAGLYRYETRAVIGTKSDGPVAGAEQGVRRLKDRYIPLLAAAYGVTEDELKRAQDRSSGAADEDAAEAEKAPETLAEKITLLLERSYLGGTAPGDQEITDSVNASAGSQVTSAEGVEALRTGEDDAPVPVVLEGLARFFDVTKLYFEPNDAVARQVPACGRRRRRPRLLSICRVNLWLGDCPSCDGPGNRCRRWRRPSRRRDRGDRSGTSAPLTLPPRYSPS